MLSYYGVLLKWLKSENAGGKKEMSAFHRCDKSSQTINIKELLWDFTMDAVNTIG